MSISALELAFRFSNRHGLSAVPHLERVWCRTCGLTATVETAVCQRYGWPTHCGKTMTVVTPPRQETGR